MFESAAPDWIGSRLGLGCAPLRVSHGPKYYTIQVRRGEERKTRVGGRSEGTEHSEYCAFITRSGEERSYGAALVAPPVWLSLLVVSLLHAANSTATLFVRRLHCSNVTNISFFATHFARRSFLSQSSRPPPPKKLAHSGIIG